MTRIPLLDVGTGILAAGLHPEMPAMTAAGLPRRASGSGRDRVPEPFEILSDYFVEDRHLDRV
jgi:hypothetical protein